MKSSEFLKKWSLTPDSFDMEDVCNRFFEEMGKGLYTADSGSSLPMIPTFCSDKAAPVSGHSVIVLDAGGTNFRTCLVTFDDDLNPVITDFKKTSMPGSDRQVSAAEFFKILADETERLLNRSSRIGFCFSYAAQITPELDGIPLVFSKEIKAPEVIGKRLGHELISEFARRGHDVRALKVGVLNDTVATLLAGKAAPTGKQYSGYIGYILGTGTNTAYVEKTSMIHKLPSSKGLAPDMIVNMESGNFSIDVSPIDIEFRKGTKDPDKYQFEKMISGAYLGPLATHVIGKAVEEGVFSSQFAERFARLPVLTTTQMSNFLEMPQNMGYVLPAAINGNEKDARELYCILDSFIARSAKLTACNLAAAIIKSGHGMDPCHPVCINADGTTLYKTLNLKRYADFYLHQFLTQKLGIYFDFVNIKDSPVIGAAIAALGL
ncbi:MAG: hexokinase [Sphaerochaetaceae bacterium]|jgi:hexokinase|nr:hexokinase [Sphaerochaetaceae bacterium]